MILHHSPIILYLYGVLSNSFGKPVRHHFIKHIITYPSPVVIGKGIPSCMMIPEILGLFFSPVINRMACQGFQDVQSFSQGR